MSTTFAGSLSNKRKSDLVEIAQALGITDVEGTVLTLRDSIHNFLEKNEEELSKAAQFKGLYVKGRNRHTSSDSETQGTPAKETAETPLKKGRKSVNKAVERLTNAIDPANIALPSSPLKIDQIQAAAENASAAAQQQIAQAGQQLSVALAPAQDLVPRQYALQIRKAPQTLATFGHQSKLRVERQVRLIQDYLSKPEQLATAAVLIELAFVLSHMLQFYNHTVFFPPAGGEKGTFNSLLHSLFFWFPSVSTTYRLPDLHSFRLSSDLWSALSWWASITILPPFALSTIISYVPQRGVARRDHATRYSESHPPSPTADPLTFALIRLAILLYPLTSAAPSSLVDSLEITGNLQVRALGAGLLAALLFVGRMAQ